MVANEKNLIPASERTPSERREIAQKAGVASGAARRAQKSLKQAAKVYFSENPNATMEIIKALVREALDGNVKAAEKLEDLLGETVAREELALKKKQVAQAAKTSVSIVITGEDDLEE